ncbi:MAG: tetraacyldisaccharide 4'-kinase [Rhodospirillaceae bacterium]|nr:tetraacyldisaccharide 4'-kinase [Rhodospirillaceae bacterium]|tara:strand:- start:942 stop:1922 length:981 start_codon:yes stop_codon:yes gene_type:complete
MRAPDFWRRKGGPLAAFLTPLGWGYGMATRLRLAMANPFKASVPVLCVGNLVAGGAGKTPVVLSLGRRLMDQGRKVHFLSRGYGGYQTGPLRVDPDSHRAVDVGDEALLLAAAAPTWISRDRALGARAAAEGADVIIMDDGFQNPSVAKDLSFLVVDGGFGFGNGRMIPAGPLREPVVPALGRAGALVVIGEDEAGIANRPDVLAGGLPVLKAGVEPGPEAEGLKGNPVVAFAGIGAPEKFFATLGKIGCSVVAAHAFPDHGPYSAGDIRRLKIEAEEKKAALATTEKDFQRLPESERDGIRVLTITLQWADEASLDAALLPLFDD